MVGDFPRGPKGWALGTLCVLIFTGVLPMAALAAWGALEASLGTWVVLAPCAAGLAWGLRELARL